MGLVSAFRGLVLAMVVMCALGCGEGRDEAAGGASSGNPSGTTLRLATTTSTENSGLLDALFPAFEARSGIHVDVIPVGTGRALRLGAQGDVDLVLVHAPEAEQEFVDAGHGVKRTPVMFNDFVILGPRDDPAGLREAVSATDALGVIARTRSLFLSRDDDSGTHKKEIALWRAAGIEQPDPTNGWYRGTGQGMGATLMIADEMGGHTLADRGTYLAFRGKIELTVLFEGDPALRNPYAVIAVNPERHPHVRHAEAIALIEWLVSDEGQGRIGEYRFDGELLFHPSVRGDDE